MKYSLLIYLENLFYYKIIFLDMELLPLNHIAYDID